MARVDAGTRRKRGDGSLAISFAAGPLMLEPAREGSAPGPVRLVYSADGQALPLPAGEYKVKNYTIEKKHKGDYWALSATCIDVPKVLIRSGQKSTLQLQRGIKLDIEAYQDAKGIVCNAGVWGHPVSGATLIHKKTRVPLSFRILDGSGRKIEEGKLTYG